MPNWCYTPVCFKGSLENITRLAEDIHETIEWTKEKKYEYLNISHFFSLNGLNVDNYCNRYKDHYHSPNFRGSIVNGFPMKIMYHGDYALLFVDCETAWYMDFNILKLICDIYNVTFSAYSEEPNMDIFTTCTNDSSIRYYNYNKLITPDYDDLEEELDRDIYFEMDYHIPALIGDLTYTRTINELENRGIGYKVSDITPSYLEDNVNLYGVYYDTIPGVSYDTE